MNQIRGSTLDQKITTCFFKCSNEMVLVCEKMTLNDVAMFKITEMEGGYAFDQTHGIFLRLEKRPKKDTVARQEETDFNA